MIKRRKKWKRGCLIILLIAAGIVWYMVVELGHYLRGLDTRSLARSLTQACFVEIAEMSSRPKPISWDNFHMERGPNGCRVNKDGLCSDGWLNPFRAYATITYERPDLMVTVRAVSSGRDGVWDTKDDIEFVDSYAIRYGYRKDILTATEVSLNVKADPERLSMLNME